MILDIIGHVMNMFQWAGNVKNTIFLRNEILFGQEYCTNETKISSIEYSINTLSNSNLYNQVLADQLIIYFLNYVKITGVITIDHYAKLRLEAPFGIDITEADFLELDVEINACHSIIHGSNRARILEFNSLCTNKFANFNTNISYDNSEDQNLDNKFTLLGNKKLMIYMLIIITNYI